MTDHPEGPRSPAGTPEKERQVISEAVQHAVEHENFQTSMEEPGTVLDYGEIQEANEPSNGVVEEIESQVDAVIGNSDEFLAMVE